MEYIANYHLKKHIQENDNNGFTTIRPIVCLCQAYTGHKQTLALI